MRPTRTWPTPDPAEPLSAEELANEGTHTFTFAAVGHGSCNPDHTCQEMITFAFGAMTLTLSRPGSQETLTYTKIGHNVYRLVAGATTAYVECNASGFGYWADVNGYACVDYVYRRIGN